MLFTIMKFEVYELLLIAFIENELGFSLHSHSFSKDLLLFCVFLAQAYCMYLYTKRIMQSLNIAPRSKKMHAWYKASYSSMDDKLVYHISFKHKARKLGFFNHFPITLRWFSRNFHYRNIHIITGKWHAHLYTLFILQIYHVYHFAFTNQIMHTTSQCSFQG